GRRRRRRAGAGRRGPVLHRLARPAAPGKFLPAGARADPGHDDGHVPDGRRLGDLLLGAARTAGAARDPDRRLPHGDYADHADAAGARGPVPRPRGRFGRGAAIAAAPVKAQPRTMTASTSNAAPRGSAETSMVERAG